MGKGGLHTKLGRCFCLFDFPVLQDPINHLIITSPTPHQVSNLLSREVQKGHVRGEEDVRIELVFEL
jgi:hypothetical protein